MSIEASRLRPDPPSALPRGTRLGEFELLHVLGVGGFGIVYLAFDHALEREVAVKEYMPASLVGRTQTLHVSLRSESDAETFALGLKSFVNEAKMLARFDHPSLLKVLRFWEANGTAYMAMPVLRGQTAKEARQAMANPPDEAWLRALLEPLLGAIERLHSEGVYHRDIAPDNIQIEADGHPVLLDFGAARRVINDKTHTLTAILKPAYAPIEQYAEVGSVKQGPWTDLYALGATLHFMLLGRPPLPSTARAVQDDLSPLATQQLPGCSEAFLNVIDWMLAPRPADRPQSAAALRDVLAGRAPQPRRRWAEAIVSDSQWDNTLIVAAPRQPAVEPTQRQATAQRLVSAQPPPATAVPQPSMHSLLDDGEQATMVMPRPAPVQAAMPRVAASGAPGLRASAAVLPAVRPSSRGRWPMLLGGFLLLALGAGAALWPSAKPKPAVVADAITTLPAPAAEGIAQPVQTTPVVTAAPAPAESTIAAANPPGLPAAEPAPAIVAPAQGVAAAASAGLPTPVVKPAVRAPDKKPVTVLPKSPAPSYSPPAPLQVQQVSQAPTAQPDPAVAASAKPTPAPALVAAGGDGADANKPLAGGPEARCVGRNALSRFVCMERECLRSEFASHADCKKWRSSAPARD